LPRSGRPVTAASPETLQRVDANIREDPRITTRQLALSLSVSKGHVRDIIHDLAYSKVCARWASRSLKVEHKTERNAISSELLGRFEAAGEALLSRIGTADETRVHHFEPQKKRQAMQRRHPQSSRKKKFTKSPSTGKVMTTVFWDSEEVLPR
jgi:hypothetical protein